MIEQVTNVLVRLEREQKQRREEAGTWKYDDGGRAPALHDEAEAAVDELIGVVKALCIQPFPINVFRHGGGIEFECVCGEVHNLVPGGGDTDPCKNCGRVWALRYEVVLVKVEGESI